MHPRTRSRLQISENRSQFKLQKLQKKLSRRLSSTFQTRRHRSIFDSPFFYSRSVVVVCKNMNATDVERLVPRLALKGCNPEASSAASTKAENDPHPEKAATAGRCIELLLNNNSTNFCRGETDLCNNYNISRGCEDGDVVCKLMHKVRTYLRTHSTRPPLVAATEAKPRPVLRKVTPNLHNASKCHDLYTLTLKIRIRLQNFFHLDGCFEIELAVSIDFMPIPACKVLTLRLSNDVFCEKNEQKEANLAQR